LNGSRRRIKSAGNDATERALERLIRLSIETGTLSRFDQQKIARLTSHQGLITAFTAITAVVLFLTEKESGFLFAM
jgi:hypothetical protein